MKQMSTLRKLFSIRKFNGVMSHKMAHFIQESIQLSSISDLSIILAHLIIALNKLCKIA